MKFKFLTFFFVYTSFLSSQNALLNTKYLEKLKEQNLELQLQKTKLEKIQILIQQKQSIFASPFYLQFSYKIGNQSQPFNLYNLNPSINQKVNEYIIGISKIIDILQTQSTEKEIFEIQNSIEKEYLLLLKQQIKNQFIESYFAAIFLKHIMEHLEEHIKKFEFLKRRYYQNYFDKKLGLYTIAALDIGISTLESEYQETKKLYLKEIEILNILLNQENQTIQFDDLSYLFEYLPKTLETPKEELINSYLNSSIYLIEIRKLQLEEKKLILIKNQKWSQIEFFLQYGIANIGQYKTLTDSPVSPEKQNFWNFGIKIPLPYGSELDHQDSLQRKEKEMQTLKIQKTQIELKNQISNYYDIFEKDSSQFRNNILLLNKHEPFLKSLEESLLNRRITYFEYWGEHERFHNLLRVSLNLLYNSLTSLHSLELLTKRNLTKIFL